MEGVATRAIEANGLTFEVACAGSGPLVLLLHGFPESSLSWRHQIEPLANAGYEVWAPNLRGYGGTSRPTGIESYKLDHLMADVSGLILAADQARAIVVGHDWGGIIAWHYTMRHPERVAGLIVLNAPHPACFERELRHWRQRRRVAYVGLFQLPRIPEWLLGASDAAAVGRSIEKMSQPGALPPEILSHHRRQASEPGALTAMLNYYRASARGDAAQQRKRGYPVIDVPTLVIWGTKDTALVEQNLDGLDDYVTDLTIERLNDAGHFVQQDSPGIVTEKILDWLPDSQAPIKTR